MLQLSPAITVVRDSRGYVFSVVAFAAVLVTLAVIQCLQGQTPAKAYVLISQSPGSTGEGSNWESAGLQETVLSEQMIADALEQVADSAGRRQLPPVDHWKESLSASFIQGNPSGEKRVRLEYVGSSPHGGLLVLALAEAYVDQAVHQPRARAADRLKSAEHALTAVQARYRAAEQELSVVEQEFDTLSAEVRADQSRVLIARAAVEQEAQKPQIIEVETDAPVDPQIAAMERSLANLNAQRVELLNQFTARHPLVPDIERRIQELSAALNRLRASTTPRTIVHDPKPEDSSSSAKAVALAEAERVLQEHRRSVHSIAPKRDRLAATLVGLDDERMAREADVGNARADLEHSQRLELQVSDAVVRMPHPFRVGTPALFFSLTLGCILGFVLSARTKVAPSRLKSKSQIESILALPVVGLLPGTDYGGDEASAAESTEVSPGAGRIRRTAELTVVAFLAVTVLAMWARDGYVQRLAAEPLSAVADSLREVAMHLLT